ncbi:MAG: aspartate-semialdehyde dehydrogenase [Calditrichaeota bacterium]|nr:aspartate-semialdehyde dehydrogenase [Calditrichota bacterium]
MTTIAIVGATGLVGQKMIQVLEERSFPVNRLIPIASQDSVGSDIHFRGERIKVQPLHSQSFRDVDLALFSAGAEISRQYAPLAISSGARVIDNSSAWRLDPAVPLVVPEVNAHTLHKNATLIANPNCSTIQLVVAIHPLHQQFRIQRILVSTYQAVTGSGKQAVQQLKEELHAGKAASPYYPHPIAFNCIPHIDQFLDNGFTREEWKIIVETRKILDEPHLPVSATAVRVPVLGGHSEAVYLELEQPFTLEAIRDTLQSAPGVVLIDDPPRNQYPMPVTAQDTDPVYVGRIRQDPWNPRALHLWVVSDNLRKGAATNAVQIAELLLKGNDEHGPDLSLKIKRH